MRKSKKITRNSLLTHLSVQKWFSDFLINVNTELEDFFLLSSFCLHYIFFCKLKCANSSVKTKVQNTAPNIIQKPQLVHLSTALFSKP